MNLKRISIGKLGIDILIVSAFVTSCSVAAKWTGEALKPKPESVEAGAVAFVPEVVTDSPKPVEYAVPMGDTSFKSYMDWECITNTNSPQYKLQEDCWTDEDGLRRYGDDYVIALGSYYAKYVGERFTITLDSGEEFTAVVGDFKADCHTDSLHRYTAMSDGGKNVIEFVVDTQGLDDMARKMGDISYIEGFEGNVQAVRKEYNYE